MVPGKRGTPVSGHPLINSLRPPLFEGGRLPILALSRLSVRDLRSRAPGPLTTQPLVDLFAVNFRAGLIDNTDVEIGIVDSRMAAKPLRHLLSMLNCRCDGRKLQTQPVPRRDSVFQIEVIGSHERFHWFEAASQIR